MSDDTKIEQRKIEHAAMKRYAAIQKAAEDKIGCQKIYVDIAGGVEEAFILDELIFFTLPRAETGKSGLRVWKDGLLWMAVSRTEWWNRKRLTAKQADGAIERLLKRNLIFKSMHLFNKQKTTHLRLNVPEFFRRYAAELENQNPPEDEGETIMKDISDLYEMMGIPKRDTPLTPPQKEQGIPKRDTASLNGDSINSPHTSLTQPVQEEDTPSVFAIYEREIGSLTTVSANFLEDAEKTYGARWVSDAITEAVKNNARNWKYVEAILKRWKAQGNQEPMQKPKGNPRRPTADLVSQAFSELAEEMQ